MRKSKIRKAASDAVEALGELPPMTLDEVRGKLLRVRDLALLWLEDCATTRTPGGTGAARTVLICVGDELERLERLGAVQPHTVNFLCNGIDVTKFRFSPSAPARPDGDGQGLAPPNG